MANVAATDLQIKCAWCGQVLHQGNPTAPDQISHGCCCECKAKYFPTLDDSSSPDCEMELVSRTHEDDEIPADYNYATEAIVWKSVTYHVDLLRCKKCSFEHTISSERCERGCGGDL